jgi:hypothetical protein
MAPDPDPLLDELHCPAHAIYVHWQFGGRTSVLEFDFTVHADPGEDVGEYFAPFNGDIDGSQIYFGIQTDVNKPVSDRPGEPHVTSAGKGLIFSTWWTFDAKHTDIAPDGFRQLGTHEGNFVGIRRSFTWGIGSYRVKLERRPEPELVLDAEPERKGFFARMFGATDDRIFDWFDLSIQQIMPPTDPNSRPLAIDDPYWIGGLRFPRTHATIPATIAASGTGFLEVYGGADTFAEITPWWLDVQAYSEHGRAASARGSYPQYPHNQDVPNSDIWYDASTGRVNMAFGGDTARAHGAGPLF